MAEEARGKVLFDFCSSCHGPDAGGNAMFLAPAIAGMEEWYIRTQLQKFQSGVRGTHPDDVGGMRMPPMALTLEKDGDPEAVAKYVASLPPVQPAPTLTGGDAARGQGLYAPCTGCHGLNGEGNQALNAPPLTHISDWYLLEQLKKYKDGVRGSNPEDTTGMVMRGMMAVLRTEQDMKDVVAYIRTLSKQAHG